MMSELAEFFCRDREFDIHLVLYGKNPELFYPLPKNLNIHQPVAVFNDRLRPIYALGRMLYVRRKIKSIDPGSILSFGEYWNTFVLIALIGIKIPVFISDRCSPDLSLGKVHNLLRKYFYPRAAGVIVQTRSARETYKQLFPKARLKVIGNPIRKISSEIGLERENIVLSVGMLIRSKHFDTLIKIFAEINMPDWKLMIVGEDALKQFNKINLKALVNELNFNDKVIFTGLSSDVDTLYLKSKIFAFTSSSEGFPNVIGEAMSAGLPVVAFDCLAGPSEMINDGKDGFLVTLFDVEQFKSKLSKLMDDKLLQERIGDEARKSIKRFSIETIGEAYFSFITSER